MPKARITFEPTGADARHLFQAEVLSTVIEPRLDIETLDAGDPLVNDIVHPFAVVATQSCDCEQDQAWRMSADRRQKPAREIPSIVLCEAVAVHEALSIGANADSVNKARDHNHHRYFFLNAILPAEDALGEGVPELLVDVRRMFSVRTDELYKRIGLEQTRRRARVTGTFREHFSQILALGFARVALPDA